MQILDRSRALVIPPLWRLGFRPFFLGGSVFALLAVPLWWLAFTGHVDWQPAGGWLAWHRHEMLFGFGSAIIAGFLLTAVQTWTGRPGLSGAPLAALAGLWLAGRLAWLLAAPPALLLPLELAFLPAVAVVLARTLWAVRQRRNYPIVLILLLFTLADALAVTGLLQNDDLLQRRGALTAVWVVLTLLGLIGGRVIPFFTQRGLNLKKGPGPLVWLDWLLLGAGILMVVINASGVAMLPHAALAELCFLLGLAHLTRLVNWHRRGIWKVPLLWSLHLAYAWLAFGTVGLGLWYAGVLPSLSQPLHALTAGAMSGAILAMLARVSLGHTGRPLQPPAGMSLAFVLLNLAVFARVVLVSVWPQPALALAAAGWTLAFALFVLNYAPMLWRARLDGNPG